MLTQDAQAPLRLAGCILGGDDMAAALGATRTPNGPMTPNQELLLARQWVVACCAAYGLQAIDIVRVRWGARGDANGAVSVD